MLPIFDIMSNTVVADKIKDMIMADQIRTIPLAFLRGITFRKSYVLIDESQNMTPEQVRLVLTRLGEKSKIIITGDIKQSDLYGKNGLIDAVNRFKNLKGVGIVELTKQSIIRHPLIADIEDRYENKKD